MRLKYSSRMLVKRRVHTFEVGRWRVTVRFDRYRMGFRRQAFGAYDGALPFVMFTALRRTKAAMKTFAS